MSEMPATKVTWINERPWVRQMDHAMAMERMVAEIGKRDAEIIVTRAELKNANLELARHRPLVEAARGYAEVCKAWDGGDRSKENLLATDAAHGRLLDAASKYAFDAAGRGEEQK